MNYTLSNSECTLSTIENCQIVDNKGCALCHENYHVINGKCVKVPIKDSCQLYMGMTACQGCRRGVFYHDIFCDAMYTIIPHCREYTTQKACKACEPGYWPSSTGMKCEYLSVFSTNCSSFSLLKCKKCADGYTLDFNLALKAPQFAERVLKEAYRMASGDQVPVKVAYCAKMNIENCKTGLNPSQCSECMPGYNLTTSKTCIKILEPSVKNCQTYSSNLDCLECATGFYPASSQFCAPLLVIDKCAKYSNSSRTTRCLYCEPAYSLSNDGTCVALSSVVISNCITVDTAAGTCLKCMDNFNLSKNSTYCYALVQNCKTYNQGNTSASCSLCNDDYYLNSATNTCVQGTISNCAEYTSQSVCARCAQGFFLASAAQCTTMQIDQEFRQNCYNAKDALNCNSCDAQSTLMNLTKTCQAVINPIANCTTYSQTQTCLACLPGFRLSNGECLKIDVTDCLAIDQNNTCTTCNDFSFLNSSVCQPILLASVSYCANWSKPTSYIPNCDRCQIGSAGLTLTGHIAFCQEALSNSSSLCEMYNPKNSCRRCIEGYVLLSNGTCIPSENCLSGILLQKLEKLDGLSEKTQENVCVETDTVTNGAKYYSAYFWDTNTATPSIACVECKPQYIPVIDPPNQAGQGHAFNSSIASGYFPSLKLPILKCVNRTIAQFMAQTAQVDLSNCQLYAEDTMLLPNATSVKVWGCFTCKLGYNGKPKALFTRNLLQNCIPLETCNAAIKLKGLGALPGQLKSSEFPSIPLETYFSCYQCKDSRQIPIVGVLSASTIFIVGNSNFTELPPGYMPFSFNSSVPASAAMNAMPFNLSKQSPCSSETYIRSLDVGGYWPNNCGAAIILIDKPLKLYASTNTSVLCIACRPGFAPQMLSIASLSYAIESCVMISNCLYSDVYNGCSNCAQNYVSGWNSTTNRPDLTICVSTKDQNCLFASSPSTCGLCKEGYLLFFDGTCQKAVLPLTSTFTQGIIRTPSGTATLDFLQYGVDISARCINPAVAYVQYMSFLKICIPHADTNDLIPNCLAFTATATPSCIECKPGFTLTASKLSCFKMTSTANCLITDSSYTCAGCRDGYYLSATKTCIRGPVANCKKYSGTTCTSCQTPLVLVGNTCIELTPLNCSALSPTSTDTYDCTKCMPDFYPVSTGLSLCVQTNPTISNCLTISGSNCVNCAPNYYVYNGACLPFAKITNCQVPLDSVRCQRCGEGYRPSPDGTSCLPNPVGIGNCLNYSAPQACAVCKPGFFLLPDSTCEEIPPSQLIPFCSVYSGSLGNLTCSACDRNYRLNSTTSCVPTVGKNCLTYDPTYSCASCASNAVLVQLDEARSCEPQNILFCLDYTQQDGRVACVKCKTGYFVNMYGNCQRATRIIADCEVYSSENLCRTCTNRKVLSADQMNCLASQEYIEQIDEQCDSTSVLPTLTCTRCAFGYYLASNSTCIKCLTDANCMHCDDTDPSKCLFCAFGTKMTPQFTCEGVSLLANISQAVKIVIYSPLIKIGLLYFSLML